MIGARKRRGRRLLRAFGLVALVSLLGFLVLEAWVRLSVDLDDMHPQSIGLTDPNRPFAYLPNTTQTFDTPELHYTVRINRFGRRDIDWSADAIASPDNILFIGDSFVIGNGVEFEATLPSRLESLMAERGERREVFNLGIPNGTPRSYGLILEEVAQQGFAARTVVVGVFVGNDFYESVLSRKLPVAAARPDPSSKQGWTWPRSSHLVHYARARASQSPLLMGWILRGSGVLGINPYRTPSSYIFLRNPGPERGSTFRAVLSLLSRIADVSREHGRDLRIVVFPNKLQVENGDDLDSRIFDHTRPNARILEYCAAHKIACYDLLPVLKATYERDGVPLYFAVDRHLNPRGTEVAAEAMLDFVAPRAD